MNPRQIQAPLPVKSDLSLIYLLSFLVTILLVAASITGFIFQSSVYPTDELVQAFVPNDFVNLFIGLPILLGSMWMTYKKKLFGLLLWPGALFFVFYVYIVYIFSMPLNWIFLAYLTLVILSSYGTIGLISCIDGDKLKQLLFNKVSEKICGGVLAGLGILFFARVAMALVSSISSGTDISTTELALNIVDFLIAPAWFIGGILLWRTNPVGYSIGFGLLFQGCMLFIGLIIALFFQPYLTGAPLPLVDILVVFVMGFVCFIPFVLFLRGLLSLSDNQ